MFPSRRVVQTGVDLEGYSTIVFGGGLPASSMDRPVYLRLVCMCVWRAGQVFGGLGVQRVQELFLSSPSLPRSSNSPLATGSASRDALHAAAYAWLEMQPLPTREGHPANCAHSNSREHCPSIARAAAALLFIHICWVGRLYSAASTNRRAGAGVDSNGGPRCFWRVVACTAIALRQPAMDAGGS